MSRDGRKSFHVGWQSDFLGDLAIWRVHVLEKVVVYCFWVPRETHLRFCSKPQWQMFLLVSGRHVGAHLDGHQHGVSTQIFINLGKKFIRVSRLKKLLWPESWRDSLHFTFFLSQILDFIYWTILILIFILTLKTSNQSPSGHLMFCLLCKH